MLKLTNIATTLRNNWKKSVFFTGALGYGAYYLLERKRNGELMQAYCLEALKYSREKINPEKEVRRVTVFLNPVANKERGRFLYDKNVAPLLHLSGLDVRLVRLDKNTEANEHIKEIDLDETDCIVVAGGNATLNEVISGLLNRELPASGRIPPLAVIPIGQTNTFAQKWYNILGMKHSNEAEIRLLASSAMAIIRGETIDADVIKVSLIHNSNTTSSDELIIPTTTDKSKIRNGGTHKLLKEDQLYALSNFSCGFLTETEANVDTYRYFWKLKEYMNRYFTDRYLRRDPLKYELAYTIKCPGCARCLNASALQRELDQIGSTNKAGGANSTNSSTLLRLFYNKVINVVPSKNKEDPVALAKREKRKSDLKILLEKSKKSNNECGKIHKSLLTQVQIIASINNPELISENSATEPSYIDTAIVKDPTFNPKSMFLAERKELDQFEIKRLQSDKPKFSKTLNSDLFSVEIDGEIYKLSNTPETELSVEVKHLEKRVKMIRADPNALAVTGNSPWPKVYLVSNKTFEEELMMSDEQKNSLEHSLTPNLLRFEKFYLKYWMSRDEFKQQYSHS